MNKKRRTQKRLLLIILMPCLLSSALLGGYFSYQHKTLLESQATQQSILLSRQLALHLASLMTTKNATLLPNTATSASHDRLRHSIQPYLNLPELRSIAVLSNTQQPLLLMGPNMLPIISNRFIEQQIHRFNTKHSIRVRAPMYAPNDALKVHMLGWLELEFNTNNTQISQYQALLSSLLMILALCLFAFYLAYKASSRITRPLQQVAATLEQLELGNLDARIQLTDEEEFSEIAVGINSMATSLHRGQQELQDNIEQATQDLKETLEEMEVQNIELNLARRSALESSNTKSEFLANMSHEIRTPLNGILGFSKLLEKTRLNKRQQEYLSTIESSSSSLLSIINDILDFSKIEAGKLVLDSAPVHIRDIADEVLAMLAPEAHKKDLELAVLVYQDVPAEIMADSTRLKQVLTNLVSNAIKFTQSGSVIVRIMLEEHIKLKVALKITITDTGIGLNDEQKKNLFKAFSQADASTTRRYGGTGLGLVISNYLVEHMQGDIGFTSQYGAGSQFWFTGKFEVCDAQLDTYHDAPWFQKCAYLLSHWDITKQALQHQLTNLGFNVKAFSRIEDLMSAQQLQPAAVCLVEIDNNTCHNSIQVLKRDSDVVALLPNNESHYLTTLQTHNLEHNLVYPVSFRRLNQWIHDALGEPLPVHQNQLTQLPLSILAVDDNHPNLELLSTWLQDLNVNVVKATGGLEAVRLGCSEKFDLIFMDIQMPDLNGVKATEKIRQHRLNSHTPLVALTAHALPNERKQLLQSGFDDYLTKPISEEQLIHTLMKWTTFQASGKASYIKSANQATATLPPADASLVVDWQRCLTLAGNKEKLAQAMLSGLIEEAKTLHIQVTNELPQDLIETVHKTHGLCKYVGAESLRQALEEAETCLKTDQHNWPKYQQPLLRAIEQLLSWDKESQWQEQLNEFVRD
jgi:two-component system sensor histidine kinase BarA